MRKLVRSTIFCSSFSPYHIFSFFHVLHCLRIHSFFEYKKSLCEMSVQLVLLIAIPKLLSPRHLFTYFRLRYTQNQIDLLNAVLRKRFYCRNVAYNVSFLTRCLNTGVCPCGVQKRVQKTKAYHSLSIERVCLKDDIARSRDSLSNARVQFKYLYDRARSFLSAHDFLRFSLLLSENDDIQRIRLIAKYDKTFTWLRKKRYGQVTFNPSSIINMSALELTDVQKELLSRGTDFGIPPSCNNKEIVMTEFELFYRKLLCFSPISEAQLSVCAAKLRAEAEEHSEQLPDRSSFSLSREHLKPVKNCERIRTSS